PLDRPGHYLYLRDEDDGNYWSVSWQPVGKNLDEADYCLKNGFEELYLTAALGGRIDQQLANLNLLEYISQLNLKARIISKRNELALIDSRKQFDNKKGFRLSLIPQTKVVKGLSISGCKYNLDSQDIERSKSRGISNLIENDQAEVSLEAGLLIYVLENLE
ncbi:MAG: thiamine diphosphokinase, partial [Halanaerobiales bacterium]|nr:thiamine diphosphokinase [Halanaerobiales bacterium]